MTLPVPAPSAPEPATTTAPESVAQFIRDHLPFLHTLSHRVCPNPDPEDAKRNADLSADLLRKLLPHLDDTTLSAVLTYAASACYQAGQLADCMDLVTMGATFAEVAQTMAWQLATPDGEGND